MINSSTGVARTRSLRSASDVPLQWTDDPMKAEDLHEGCRHQRLLVRRSIWSTFSGANFLVRALSWYGRTQPDPPNLQCVAVSVAVKQRRRPNPC